MVERDAKITFSRAGNGKGARIILSIPVLQTLGITEQSRDVTVIYDDVQRLITIKPKR